MKRNLKRCGLALVPFLLITVSGCTSMENAHEQEENYSPLEMGLPIKRAFPANQFSHPEKVVRLPAPNYTAS